MNLLIAFPACVGHENRDVVAGMADVMIEQQPGSPLPNVSLHGLLQAFRRSHIATDRADIGLDDA